MTRPSFSATAFVTTLAVLLAFSARPIWSQAGKEKLRINVDDIGKKVVLIGRLGEPLGTWVTLKGTWELPKLELVKDYSLRFMVTRINDRELSTPIEFNIAQIEARFKNGKDALPAHEHQKTLDGVTWTLRAYETGYLLVAPMPEVVNPGGRIPPAPQVPYYSRPFTSSLHATVQVAPGAQKTGKSKPKS